METLTESLYSIQAPAGWISQSEIDLTDASRQPHAPYFFLLADYQATVRDGKVESYLHTVEKINDSSRIEDASLYLREMDDESQRVIFHGVDIIRNGNRFSVMDPENIEVYRRETSLESHITNNRQTVSLFVDDLRVGDLIEYRATLIGKATQHPLWVKHVRAIYWLTWDCPVLLQKVRIVNRSNRTLKLHHHRIDEGRPFDDSTLLKPRQEFKREYPELMPKKIAATAPDWWWTDFLIVTRNQSWRQISRYLYRYYSEAGALSNSFDIGSVDRIELCGEQREDALRIIRFVQNEIRYRGQHQGVYTHTPKAPELVLKKGAGDCKDKSNLLRALLAAIGVQCDLALVNTNCGKSLDGLNPSARHFNHMIVRIQFDNEAYYFDATAQKQAGNFEHAAQLDYGFALILTETGEDLVNMPFDISRKVFFVKHGFDFRDPGNDGGILTITRRYMAHRADDLRYRFASRMIQRLRDDYLEDAQDATSLELAVIAPVAVVKDDLDKNILVTREQYRISNLEKTHGDSRIELGTRFYKAFPEPSDDRFPVQITAFGAAEHRIDVYYPGKPPEGTSSRRFSNPIFSYVDRVWIEGNVKKFGTRVTPHREVVNPDGIEQYRNDIEKMFNRSINCFSHKADDEADEREEQVPLPWRETIAYPLFWWFLIGVVWVFL